MSNSKLGIVGKLRHKAERAAWQAKAMGEVGFDASEVSWQDDADDFERAAEHITELMDVLREAAWWVNVPMQASDAAGLRSKCERAIQKAEGE